MGEIEEIVRTLGGIRIVPARSFEELRQLLRTGLPYAALAAFATGFQIELADAVSILRIPARTLARRKKERRLSADESDRLFRLGRVATLAQEVLGSRDQAARWLQTPNRALGRAKPLAQLDTDLGAEQVERTLLRLAHGVYS